MALHNRELHAGNDDESHHRRCSRVTITAMQPWSVMSPIQVTILKHEATSDDVLTQTN